MVLWGPFVHVRRQVSRRFFFPEKYIISANLRFSLRNEKETNFNPNLLIGVPAVSFGEYMRSSEYHIDLRDTFFQKWLFRLDDSKHLHGKWWSNHFHPFETGCLEFQAWTIWICFATISIGWMKYCGEVIWLSLRGGVCIFNNFQLFNVYYNLQPSVLKQLHTAYIFSPNLPLRISEAFSSNHKKSLKLTILHPPKIVVWKTRDRLLDIGFWHLALHVAANLRCTEPSEWGWRRTQKGWTWLEVTSSNKRGEPSKPWSPSR